MKTIKQIVQIIPADRWFIELTECKKRPISCFALLSTGDIRGVYVFEDGKSAFVEDVPGFVRISKYEEL